MPLAVVTSISIYLSVSYKGYYIGVVSQLSQFDSEYRLS